MAALAVICLAQGFQDGKTEGGRGQQSEQDGHRRQRCKTREGRAAARWHTTAGAPAAGHRCTSWPPSPLTELFTPHTWGQAPRMGQADGDTALSSSKSKREISNQKVSDEKQSRARDWLYSTGAPQAASHQCLHHECRGPQSILAGSCSLDQRKDTFSRV